MATILPQLDTAALPPAVLTLDEYLRTAYRPDVDFVDDHIEDRNLGELEHSTLQAEIVIWFGNHRSEWNIRIATEYRTRVSSDRVRIPDISVFLNDGIREKVRTTPPLLCIEILSPEDRIPRVVRRLEEFLAMGVQNVWIVDPLDREAFTFTREGLRLVDGKRIDIAGTAIHLDLAEVFAALD